jgi:hypothetical protein
VRMARESKSGDPFRRFDSSPEVIHVFNPGIQIADIQTKAPRNPTFKGEVTRVILRILRGLTAPELAAARPGSKVRA